MYMQMTKSVQIDVPWGLILMLPLARNHRFHFSRFAQPVPNLVAKSLRNWILWVPLGAHRWNERGSENIKNTSPQKYQQMSQICSKRRVPQSDCLRFFRVPIPRWSPGRPRAGSKAQKHAEMEAPRWIFWYLIIIMSYFLEAFWRCFVYSINNSLGGKPKVGYPLGSSKIAIFHKEM